MKKPIILLFLALLVLGAGVSSCKKECVNNEIEVTECYDRGGYWEYENCECIL